MPTPLKWDPPPKKGGNNPPRKLEMGPGAPSSVNLTQKNERIPKNKFSLERKWVKIPKLRKEEWNEGMEKFQPTSHPKDL